MDTDLDRAVSLAVAMRDEDWRTLVLDQLVCVAVATDVTRAVEITANFRDVWFRSRAMLPVVVYVAVTRGLDEALDLAERLPHVELRLVARTLSAVAVAALHSGIDAGDPRQWHDEVLAHDGSWLFLPGG